MPAPHLLKMVKWQDLLNLLPGGPIPPLGGGNHMTQETVVTLWNQVYNLSGAADLDHGLKLEAFESPDEGPLGPPEGEDEDEGEDEGEGQEYDGSFEQPVMDEHQESPVVHVQEELESHPDGPLEEHEDDFEGQLQS